MIFLLDKYVGFYCNEVSYNTNYTSHYYGDIATHYRRYRNKSV